MEKQNLGAISVLNNGKATQAHHITWSCYQARSVPSSETHLFSKNFGDIEGANPARIPSMEQKVVPNRSFCSYCSNMFQQSE